MVESNMRTLVFGLIAAASIAGSSPPAMAQYYYSTGVEPRTTRIEPRPFYGAVVTMEKGVRVFRPLPPHDRVIINPGNATPVGIDVGTGSRRYYLDGSRR
jgi:hypothetical protein